MYIYTIFPNLDHYTMYAPDWNLPIARDINNSAVIAQLGERQTEDLKVTGSIPVRGNFFFFLFVFLVYCIIMHFP